MVMTGRSGKPLQYLQMMYTYAPAWGFGGPSRIMYDYAHGMALAGATARVIAGDIHHDFTSNKIRSETMDGILVERVRVYLRALVRRSLNCVSPAMLRLAFRRVREQPRTTVVHIAEFRSPVFLYAAVLKLLLPRRVVLVHSAFGMLYYKPSRMRRLYDPIFMGFMMKSVDVGLAQNEHELAAYRSHCIRYRAFSARVELVPLHTPGPRRSPEEAALPVDVLRERLRQQYDIPQDALVCIFLGRLHQEKGVLRAIDAFLAFAKRVGRPALFLVVGRDDGFQGRIESYVADSGAGQVVRIVNDVYEHRFDYYSLADMFLGFPTINEETMLSSVEALSCGTPIVVSREADIPFVEADGGGFVIEYSLERAVQCMELIAADRAGFRVRAQSVADAHFTGEAAFGAFRSVIERAVAARAEGLR